MTLTMGTQDEDVVLVIAGLFLHPDDSKMKQILIRGLFFVYEMAYFAMCYHV